MSTHNATNWPPLQINGVRVRAGYAYFSDTEIRVTTPAFKGVAKNTFADLIAALNNQADVEVLFSRSVPLPKGEPARMCGGKYTDPEGYIAKVHYIDLMAIAGDRIDLELFFNVVRKLDSCAYGSNDSSHNRVLTWDDLNVEASQISSKDDYRSNESIGELMLRLSPGLVTGCFAGAENVYTRSGIMPRDFYDIDEYDARITIGDLKLR